MANTFQLISPDGHVYDIGERGLTIGRHTSNQVIVHDASVSRLHARLWAGNGRCFVRDEKSKIGTYVNRQRVTDVQEVHPGDNLQIGTAVFRLAVGTRTFYFQGKPYHEIASNQSICREISEGAYEVKWQNTLTGNWTNGGRVSLKHGDKYNDVPLYKAE